MSDMLQLVVVLLYVLPAMLVELSAPQRQAEAYRTFVDAFSINLHMACGVSFGTPAIPSGREFHHP